MCVDRPVDRPASNNHVQSVFSLYISSLYNCKLPVWLFMFLSLVLELGNVVYCCVSVCVGERDCVSVYVLLTPSRVWLPPFRPVQAVTRQENWDPVSSWMRL